MNKEKCIICGSIRNNQAKILLPSGEVVHNFHKGVSDLYEVITGTSKKNHEVKKFKCGCEVHNSDLQTCPTHSRPIHSIMHVNGVLIAKIIRKEYN